MRKAEKRYRIFARTDVDLGFVTQECLKLRKWTVGSSHFATDPAGTVWFSRRKTAAIIIKELEPRFPGHRFSVKEEAR